MIRSARLYAGGALILSSITVHAQNSVTLYGMVDTLIDISNQGHGTEARMGTGGMNGSNWGLSGREDLGNGFKAIFILENGFGSNDGTIQQGGALFGRQAYVGFANDQWGSVTFGRQYTPQYLVNTASDAFSHAFAGGLSNVYRTVNGSPTGLMEAYALTARTNNSVLLTSPTFDGLTVKVLYGLGGVAGSFSAGSTISTSANYAAGPIGLRAGYTHELDADKAGSLTAYTIGGSYAIGPARILVGYSKDADTAANTPVKAAPALRYALANVGLQYDVNPALRLLAQVTKIIDTSDGLLSSQNAYIEAIGAEYSFSKSTTVYVAYGQVSNKGGSQYSLAGGVYTGAVAARDATGRSVQIGMQKRF